jgi:XTP/dITP diphosphohydrolase/tetrapyrrole methylase family protein/MazG family protein/ATP diphosphatase
VHEELAELESACRQGGEPAAETEPDADVFHELGDLLFTVVNVGRRLNVDPELALRAAADRFVERVEGAATLAEADGQDWRGLDLATQDAYYDRAKEGLG